MATRNFLDPRHLLAELQRRHEVRQDINDLLPDILQAVEAWAKHPYPRYWVCEALKRWATHPGTLASESKYWHLKDDQWAALAKEFHARTQPTAGSERPPAQIA